MKCRPNDIAIILESDFPENVGQFVTVIRLSPDDPKAWICKPMAPGRVLNLSTGEVENGGLEECYIDDIRLQPIRGSNEKTNKASKLLELTL
jgi:hypothetical protein